ncbi:MAG: hypothetical protein K2X93_07680 [Candidatus Obscuribacterales bacterium]|nr:hypothetical protein [Candidatus Obscuribacterales bacterium]
MKRLQLSANTLSRLNFLISVLHPCFFALWPIFLAVHECAWDVFGDVLWCLVPGAILSTALLQGLFYRLTRDSVKAGICTSAVVVWFFGYGGFRDLVVEKLPVLATLGGADYYSPGWLVPVLYWCILGALLWYLSRVKQFHRDLALALTLVSFGLFAYNAFHFVRIQAQINKSAQRILTLSKVDDRRVPVVVPDDPPDIYYIIFDMMCGDDVMTLLTGVEDHSFQDTLRDLGFYVAVNSHTNYEHTRPSLASSLNMMLLDDVSTAYRRCAIDERENPQLRVCGKLIRDNRLVHYLRRAGYKFVNYSSGCEPTNWNPCAEINIPSGMGDATTLMILTNTVCATLPVELDPRNYLARLKRVTFVQQLDGIKKIDGPKFVLIHCMLPHWPLLFTAKGKPTKVPYQQKPDYFTTQDYVRQMIFTRKLMLSAIKKLLKSKRRPIIVIQGDHGPWFKAGTREHHEYTLPIFNAYYLPPGGRDIAPWSTISPVNSFRLILNRYFGADYKFLPDKSHHDDGLNHLMGQELPTNEFPLDWDPTQH